MTYKAMVKRTLPLSRARVFAILNDFGGLHRILPSGVASCECVGEGVGAVRTITFVDFAGTLVERLDVAHAQSVFAYSIIANDALPVENYCAVVTLTDDGNHTAVTYGSNWFPKGATEKAVRSMLEGFYNGVLDYMEGLATADPGDRALPQQ